MSANSTPNGLHKAFTTWLAAIQVTLDQHAALDCRNFKPTRSLIDFDDALTQIDYKGKVLAERDLEPG